MNKQQGRRQSMIGFQLLLQGMQNGGTQLSTMSLPWWELVSSVSLMPCQSLDGMFSSTFFKSSTSIFPSVAHFIMTLTSFFFYRSNVLSVIFRGPGIAVLILSWVITLYTLWQMVEMHEMVPGKRFDRYHELGQHAFGEKLGLYIVVPQQLIVEVGVCIVYMVTGGKSLKKFHDVVCSSCKPIKQTYFIMIFASVHFVLSHLPNFNSISGVSLAAAVMSLR